jgi:hypothetical protein
VEKCGIQLACLRLSHSRLHTHTSGAKLLRPAGGDWIRISRSDDYSRYSSLDDRIHARGIPTVMAAGLEIHVQGTAASPFSRRRDCLRLRVRRGKATMKSFADLFIPVVNHRSDQRIRRDLTPAPSGQLERDVHALDVDCRDAVRQ